MIEKEKESIKNTDDTKESYILKGTLIKSDNQEIKATIEVTNQVVILKCVDDTQSEILIPYRNLILFGLNKENNFIWLTYTKGEEEDSFLKFKPEVSDQCKNKFNKLVNDLYEDINNANILHPTEEFNDEPEGDNELYTAESFK